MAALYDYTRGDTSQVLSAECCILRTECWVLQATTAVRDYQVVLQILSHKFTAGAMPILDQEIHNS